MRKYKKNLCVYFLGIAILLPIFFRLRGEIYRDLMPVLDSRGELLALPLPASLLACAVGLLFFILDIRKASIGIAFVTAMLAAMAMSILLTGIQSRGVDKAKVLLALQFILPTFALILGMQVVGKHDAVAKSWLYLLLLFIPAQLAAGWTQGAFTLTHNVYLFSVYQHLQYVPLIMVAASAFTASMLWKSHPEPVLVLMVMVSIYSVTSVSFLTIFACGLFVVGCLSLNSMGSIRTPLRLITAFAFCFLIAVAVASVFLGPAKFGAVSLGTSREDQGYIDKFVDLSKGKMPINVEQRIDIFRLYTDGIFQSPTVFFVGHIAPPSRGVKTSAHNWYLDMVYNFGLLGVLPMFGLIAYTIYLVRISDRPLKGETLWLILIVGYLVIVDNNFKVTLRQPYPGIFTFFLWGLLLSLLRPQPPAPNPLMVRH